MCGSLRVLRARLCPLTDELINHAVAWMYGGVSGETPPPPISKKEPRRLLRTGLPCLVAKRGGRRDMRPIPHSSYRPSSQVVIAKWHGRAAPVKTSSQWRVYPSATGSPKICGGAYYIGEPVLTKAPRHVPRRRCADGRPHQID